MKTARVIYHLARADFLERVRRYSFLVILGLVILLGYQTAIGNVRLQLGQYRGEFNSAWIAGMMSIIITFFLGWFGFYLVKGSVARDRETGVGQIMATTTNANASATPTCPSAPPLWASTIAEPGPMSTRKNVPTNSVT